MDDKKVMKKCKHCEVVQENYKYGMNMDYPKYVSTKWSSNCEACKALKRKRAKKDEKKCGRCKFNFKLDTLGFNNRTNKTYSTCQMCRDEVRISDKKYREKLSQKEKDEVAARQKKYAQENKDKINARRRKYYEENKDSIAKRHKEYEKKNRDKINAKKRMKNKERKENMTVDEIAKKRFKITNDISKQKLRIQYSDSNGKKKEISKRYNNDVESNLLSLDDAMDYMNVKKMELINELKK